MNWAPICSSFSLKTYSYYFTNRVKMKEHLLETSVLLSFISLITFPQKTSCASLNIMLNTPRLRKLFFLPTKDAHQEHSSGLF